MYNLLQGFSLMGMDYIARFRLGEVYYFDDLDLD